jgi:Domain of unknown function (DUF1707)
LRLLVRMAGRWPRSLPKLIVMDDPESSAPVLRASDAERERAADLLREAMASGRLSVDELDQRMRLVFSAKTRTELERLVDDVLVPTDDRHPIASPAAALVPGGGRLPGPGGEDGTRRIRSILGGSERRGRWRAASCSVVNVLGGSKLDLSEVELAADRVDLKIVSVLGGAEITLPPGSQRGDLRIRDSRRQRNRYWGRAPRSGRTGAAPPARLNPERRRGPPRAAAHPRAAQGAQAPSARVRARSLTARLRQHDVVTPLTPGPVARITSVGVA